MDLRNGWKYVLENYPQVTHIRSPIVDVLLMIPIRSTLTARLLLERVMEVTPSSRLYSTSSSPGVLTTDSFPSWIQGNPEFGFGFKALVCHDGVSGLIQVLPFCRFDVLLGL